MRRYYDKYYFISHHCAPWLLCYTLPPSAVHLKGTVSQKFRDFRPFSAKSLTAETVAAWSLTTMADQNGQNFVYEKQRNKRSKKQTFKETNVQKNKRSKEQTFKGTNVQRNEPSKEQTFKETKYLIWTLLENYVQRIDMSSLVCIEISHINHKTLGWTIKIWFLCKGFYQDFHMF